MRNSARWDCALLGISVVIAAMPPGAYGAVSFHLFQPLDDVQPSAMLLGDLDGDGDLDLYISTFSFETAGALWMNDGTGRFQDSRQAFEATMVEYAALGDLDGDGDLDLLTGSSQDNDALWINDGSGAFAADPYGAVLQEKGTSHAALGDLDGDGDLDIFVTCFGNVSPGCLSNTVLFNDGNGEFETSEQSFETSSFISVSLGDLDNDGDLDAFLTRAFTSEISEGSRVWLNDGNGTFEDSGQSLYPSDIETASLGDVDGDGDLDVLLSQFDQFDEIWLNDGNGRFEDSGERVGGPDRTWFTLLLDIDGDGDMDAVLGGKNEAMIWLNDGEGRFAPEDAGVVFQSAAFGDLDGDGDVDAAARNVEGCSVWLNGIRKKLTAVHPEEAAHDALVDADISVTVIDDAGSINSDATLIAYGNFRGRISSTFTRDPLQITAELEEELNPGEQVQVTAKHLTPYSIDGEVLTGSYVWQFRTEVTAGAGWFVDSGQALGEADSYDVVLGDVDGDGDLDAVTVNSWIVGDEFHDEYSRGERPDGYGSKLWLNDGGGVFTDSGQNFETGRSAALGDLNGDGRLDLYLVLEFEGNDIVDLIYLNTGNGTLEQAAVNRTPVDSYCYEYGKRGPGVQLGDLDNDGDLDVIVGRELCEWIGSIWMNNGDARFYRRGTFPWILFSDLGDLDDDGDLDMLVANESYGAALNDGTGHFTLTEPWDGGTIGDPTAAVLGDLDGNGTLDVFFANGRNARLNDGEARFRDNGQMRLNYPGGSVRVALGDLDGDGDLDVVSANASGANTVLLNESGADTDTDTAADAGTDTARDTDTDTNADSNGDAGVDGGDTGTDTGTDTGADGSKNESRSGCGCTAVGNNRPQVSPAALLKVLL